MKILSKVLTLSLLVSLALTQECDSNGVCDKHERCPVWKDEGECFKSRSYMKENCPVSCRKTKGSPPKTGECKDQHERCEVWARLGECEENPKDMNEYCAKSCGTCGKKGTANKEDEIEEDDILCVDNHKNCNFWASKGECDSNSNYMHAQCPKSCGVCERSVERKAASVADAAIVLAQTAEFGVKQVAEGDKKKETLKRIEQSVQYMKSEQVTTLSANLIETCQNRHELCSFWTILGECEKNKAYMTTNCAPACMTCHLIDIENRCPPLENPNPALHPGDLNKMFERIVRTAPGNRTLTEKEKKELTDSNMTEYSVVVHSRPSTSPAIEVSAVLDKTLPPWVITFEDFLTPEECDGLIQLGYKYEYKRSEDVGEKKFDGSHASVKSERRTSENAWCSDFQGCRKEPLAQRIHNRMAKVMGIPAENSEDLQLLRYEKGQFYRIHHDYIPHQVDRQCGPRILTFFLYLSDVEAGGGTNFPQLELTVEPKKGRALLWPSTLDSDPLKIDSRMMHQALEVEEGVKFAANGWIHMFDYKTAQANGCN